MNTDVIIRTTGMDALREKLGMVESERFIMLIKHDSFDYTKWRENLFEDMTLDELYEKASEFHKSILSDS
jgi:hypothetical protein